MIPLKVSYKSEYLKTLQERILKWKSKSSLGVKITIPPELAWIWWLEYGTREGKGPYIITPSGKSHLVFVSNGVLHFEERVVHPGIRPRRFIVQSLPEIKELISKSNFSIMLDNPSAFEEELRQVGQKAKDIITDNMAAVTKSPQEKLEEQIQETAGFEGQQGRLKGEAPSVVFDREAKVEVI